MGREYVSIAAIIGEQSKKIIGHRFIKIGDLNPGVNYNITKYTKEKLENAVKNNEIPVIYHGGQNYKNCDMLVKIKKITNQIDLYSNKDGVLKLIAEKDSVVTEFCQTNKKILNGTTKHQNRLYNLIYNNTVYNEREEVLFVLDCFNIIRARKGKENTEDKDMAKLLELSLKRNPMLIIGKKAYLTLNNQGNVGLVVEKDRVETAINNIRIVSAKFDNQDSLHLKLKVSDSSKIKPYNKYIII